MVFQCPRKCRKSVEDLDSNFLSNFGVIVPPPWEDPGGHAVHWALQPPSLPAVRIATATSTAVQYRLPAVVR